MSDGDTITAVTNNQTKLRLRLISIYAPEVAHGTKPAHPYGKEARDTLEQLIGGMAENGLTQVLDRRLLGKTEP